MTDGGMHSPEHHAPAATIVHQLLARRSETVAVAESLTGGLLSATLVEAPGASATYRGGLIVYATDLKASLAGVSAELLDERGPVDREVAEQLALGAVRRCGADWGVATTGVAGPDPQGGQPPGTVWLAIAGPRAADGARSYRLSLEGSRAEIIRATVAAALGLLAEELERASAGAGSVAGIDGHSGVLQ